MIFAMLVFLPMQCNGVGSRADTEAMQAVTGQWPGRLTAGRRGHFRNEEAARGLNRGWVIHGKDTQEWGDYLMPFTDSVRKPRASSLI